ncbi:MAG: SdiA-regulated domain-containing protein, partial [Calditrichia bacterium]|nr:SdiA-regulated domain-containing protein [Calditrichia bacterium]
MFNCKSVDEKFSSTLNKKLVLLNTYSLSVPEPSGLCFDNITNSLWTVSDSTGKIYNLKLNGELIREISLSGSLDLEGVCLNFSGNFLFVVNEQIREIIKVSLSGTTESRKQILEGNDNIGLEGICSNPANGHFFVVKEKSPGMLIELSSGLNILN